MGATSPSVTNPSTDAWSQKLCQFEKHHPMEEIFGPMALFKAAVIIGAALAFVGFYHGGLINPASVSMTIGRVGLVLGTTSAAILALGFFAKKYEEFQEVRDNLALQQQIERRQQRERERAIESC